MNFKEQIWQICKQVPKGKVTTYKEIALCLNSKAYRAVGNALKQNPYSPDVPCHRVVASDGGLGGFMGKTRGRAIERKIRLLLSEGVELVPTKNSYKIKNFEQILHRF